MNCGRLDVARLPQDFCSQPAQPRPRCSLSAMAGTVSPLSCDRGHIHPVRGWSRDCALILSPNSICLHWYLECSHFVFCPRCDPVRDTSQRQTHACSVIRVGRRRCLYRRETVDGGCCFRMGGTVGGAEKEDLHLRSHHTLSC